MQLRPSQSSGAGARPTRAGAGRGGTASGGGVLTGPFLLYVVGSFLGLYCLAQLWLLGFMGGVFGGGQAALDKAKDKAAARAAAKAADVLVLQQGALRSLSAAASVGGGSSGGDGIVADAVGLVPFVYGRSVELPFPDIPGDDEGVSVFAAISKTYVANGALRQAVKDAERGKPKNLDAPVRGGKYDGTSVTVGHPCWTDYRLLWKMGLDRMADDMDEGAVPSETRRARAPHALAALAADLSCTFYSTPIAGGLQCCCSSNTSIPYMAPAAGKARANEAPANPGTFFCLPSTVVLGARNSGAGLLGAFFMQHAYHQHTVALPPPRVVSAVRSPYVVDSVIARYALHYSSQMVAGWQDLALEARAKAVSGRFWVDNSPDYFYAVNAAILLRKLLPRSKVIVVLRDPVERAYADLVASVRRSSRREAEARLLALTHACMTVVACGPAGNRAAPGALSPSQWGAPKATDGARAPFEACMLLGAENVPGLLGGESGGSATAQGLAQCIGDAVRPGGPADWGQLRRLLDSAPDQARQPPLQPCAEDGGPAFEPASGVVPAFLSDEAARLWNRLTRSLRAQVASCLEPPPSAEQKPPQQQQPPVAVLLAAVEAAAARLAPCSLAVTAGMALPVPVDLMAANINGYDLGLFAVAGEMPREGTAADIEGKVLLDGSSDECFPEGVDTDDAAAPLARSLYLRPLQRLHAAYGRETVLMYQTSTLRTDPSAVMDAIFTEMSVYKPTLDPVQGRYTCREMGWRGIDLQDCDVRVPIMEPEVKAAIEKVLAPYTAALKAYVADDGKRIRAEEDAALALEAAAAAAARAAAPKPAAAAPAPAAPAVAPGKPAPKRRQLPDE